MRLRLIFWMCCWCGFALAQPPRHFRHFTERDGLSDNRVQAIVRDRTGFLWVGTMNGLNVFDGYSFRQYLPNPQQPDRSISSACVNDLLEDDAGKIWIATNDGLNCYDPVTRRFRQWQNVGRGDGSLPNPIVWDMALDARGRLWLSCDNRDLCRYDPATDKFITYPWRDYVRQVLPETAADAYLVIYGLHPKSASEFWLGANKGIFSFDWEKELFAFYPFPKSIPIAHASNTCPQVTRFGSWDLDILQYDPCAKAWERILLPLSDTVVGGRRLVTDIFPYHDGYCVLSRQGLYWMPRATQVVASWPKQGDETDELPVGLLTDTYLDHDGNLWLGGEQGLWLSEPLHQAIQYQNLKPSGRGDFYNTYARVLDVPGLGRLCLDFYFHELLLVQGNAVVHRWQLPRKANLLHRDRLGHIWVGGGNEIFQLDTATLALRPFPLPKTPIWRSKTDRYFSDMAVDGQGNYWFGNFGSGLVVWRPNTQDWWIPDSSQGYISKNVTALLYDPHHHTMWIGSEEYGLFRYDEGIGRFTLYQHDPKNATHSLGAFIVTGLALDSLGYVWAATDPGGLSRFDYAAAQGQEFLNVGAAQGMPSNRATSVVCDRRGRLWAGTVSGIACLDPLTRRIRAFTNEDGLITDFVDQPLCLGSDGSILNGTIYGYQSFQPDSLLRERLNPGINLTSFKIFDRELGDSLRLNGLPHLELTYSQNFFSFEFASYDVTASRKMVYGYRLQGFDQGWIETGHRRQGSYTNVPPGDYVLEIRSGQEGRWNAAGIQLPIHIAPPFWVTWWFRILVVLAVAGLVYLVYALRVRQIRREEALKTEFNQRIAHTEMAALRAQMNPHFVFNCLSSINRFILVNQPEEASAYLTKFARLIRLILDNSRTDTVILAKELEALRLYIELEQMRFSDRFAYTLEIDPDLQVEHVEIPPLLIQPYVENAIWHGLMHKKGSCLLQIRLFPKGKGLCIEIEDDGVGRAMAMELKSRSATAQKSHGMKVTSERLEVINRLYGTQATVVTTDLRDATGAAVGTLVRLTL
jgi:ligand-binding sensor domain-containing protein